MQRSSLVPFLPVALLAACASQPEVREGAPYHDKPIVESEGRTMLWAGDDDDWFDMTDAAINPATFQYGMGRDAIPSVDAPEFAGPNDPRLKEFGIGMDTMVLGVTREGVSKAYPVAMMDGHEVVNDDFNGEAYAVLW